MKGIKYVSLYGAIGSFVAAKRYMLALLRSGVPLTWTPMVPGDAWGMALQPFAGQAPGDRELDPICNRPLEYDTVIVHSSPDLFLPWRQRERGKRLVGYTAWETDRVPDFWPEALDAADLVIVPSTWTRDVVRRCGTRTPVLAVPHIVPPGAGAPAPRPDDGPFAFYAIETWTARKNLEGTIGLFLETFRRHEPVSLVVKTFPRIYRQTPLTGLAPLKRAYNRLRRSLGVPGGATLRPGASARLERIRGRHGGGAAVELITAELPWEGIVALHRRCDCYLSLSHGEGWGLGAFDAAAYGNPVIVTGHGGPLDYLSPDLAGLVDHDLVPARDDDSPRLFNAAQSWAEPRPLHAAALMRQAFADRGATREKARRLQESLLARFAPERVAGLLLASLRPR